MSSNKRPKPLNLKITKVTILGAGQFGFAVAKLLGDKNKDLPIVLYDPIKEYIESIQNNRTHPVFHKGVTLPQNVTATNSFKDAIADATVIVIAVPGQFIRGSVKDWAPLVTNDVIVLNLSKALEKGTNRFLHDVIEEEWNKVPHTTKMYFAALAGGMLAEEVTQGVPIAADIACADLSAAELLSDLFETPEFHVRITTDVIGVELAGALKNVMAIGAGLFDGLGLAVSSKSAYVSMCAEEFKQIALMLGARPETYEMGSLAWLADVLTTCYGPGRNRLFGELIGSGKSVDEALAELQKQKKISEGYLTTKAFYELMKSKGLHSPFLDTCYALLFQGRSARQTVEDFFRPQSKMAHS